MFAGTAQRGVFRSIDNGQSWEGPSLEDQDVLALAISPSSGHTFAGVKATSQVKPGIFRSADGFHWTDFGLRGTSVSALAVNSSGYVFAGTSGSVRRTTIHAAAGWAPVLRGTPVHDLTINPSGHIFAGTDAGLFRSTDNGDNWTLIGDLRYDWAPDMEIAIRSVAINSSGHIFAGTQHRGVWRSTDGGATWAQASNGLPENPSTDDYGRYLNSYVLALAINSSDDIYAMVGPNELFRSTDGGANWSAVNTGFKPTWRALVINSSEHIFVGTAGGVLRSTDDGQNWTETNTGLTIAEVRTVAGDAAGQVFAGTPSGVYLSTNKGETWVRAGLTDTPVYALAISPSGAIFAGTPEGLFHSSDNGATWIGGPVLSSWPFVFSVAINSSGEIFATSDYKLFRSTDNGQTWTAITSGLRVGRVAINSSDHIFATSYSPAMSAYVVARSTDNGASWTTSVVDSSYIGLSAIAIGRDGRVFVVTGTGAYGTPAGVYVSTDNGQSWTAHDLKNSDIGGFNFNNFIQSLASVFGVTLAGRPAEDILFAGTTIMVSGYSEFAGVVFSEFAGTWVEANSGLGSLRTLAFTNNPSGDIFAGTAGGGVFRYVPLEPLSAPSLGVRVSGPALLDHLRPCFMIASDPSIPWSPDLLNCPALPEPGCPECYGAFTMKRPTQDPRWEIIYRIYDQVYSFLFLLENQPSRLEEHRKQIIRVFQNAPLGRNFSQHKRRDLISLVRTAEKPSPEAYRIIISAVNAVDLDLWLPELRAQKVITAVRQEIAFDELASVVLGNVVRSGQLSLEVTDQIPGVPEGFAVGWPMAAYSFKFTGDLAENEVAIVRFHIAGLNRGGDASEVRLLEWDGKGFRDITIALDRTGETIAGMTRKLSTYLIVRKTH